jgi:hypothetical protein
MPARDNIHFCREHVKPAFIYVYYTLWSGAPPRASVLVKFQVHVSPVVMENAI